MAKFQITLHETWYKQFDRIIEAESEAEALRIAETAESEAEPYRYPEEAPEWELMESVRELCGFTVRRFHCETVVETAAAGK